MNSEAHLDYMLNDCFFAVGQAVGTRKPVDYAAIVWWRDRYRDRFLRAITVSGNCFSEDRERLIGVGHLLGERAFAYSGALASVDAQSAMRGSADVETACRLRARRMTAKD